MNTPSERSARARREVRLRTSVEALETRNLLSAAGTIVPPTLTALEKAIVHSLDAYVNAHPGALTNLEQSRQALLTAVSNHSPTSLVGRLDQAALDVVDQVLIDHGIGVVRGPAA